MSARVWRGSIWQGAASALVLAIATFTLQAVGGFRVVSDGVPSNSPEEQEDETDLRTAAFLAQQEGGSEQWKLMGSVDAMLLEHRALELQLARSTDQEWENGGMTSEALAVKDIDQRLTLLGQRHRHQFIPDHVINPFISDEWRIVACVVFTLTCLTIARDEWIHRTDAEKRGHVRGYGIVPTLFKLPRPKPPERPEYQTSCIWALAALREEPLGSWNGRWKLTDAEIRELIHKIETFDGVSAGDDGKLQFEEISTFAKDQANRIYIESLPPAAYALLVPDQMKKAFDEFDADKSGSLDKREFAQFCNSLARAHIEYLQMLALVSFQAFYGRDQPWPENVAFQSHADHEKDLRAAAGLALERVPPALQLGLDPDRLTGAQRYFFPVGWAADYTYFCANTHPFLGIFLCDPMHALSSVERMVMELTTIFMSFSAIYFKHETESGNPPFGWKALEDPTVFSIIVVTLPGILLWQFLFYLFTTPAPIGGYVDVIRSDQKTIRKAWLIRTVCAAIGYVLVGAAFCVFIPVFVIPYLDDLGMILRGRLTGYVIALVIPLCKAYNPFFALGQPDPFNTSTFTLGFIGGLVGIGQWRIEKQKVQAICANCVRMYYTSDGFFEYQAEKEEWRLVNAQEREKVGVQPEPHILTPRTPRGSPMSVGPPRKSGLCC